MKKIIMGEKWVKHICLFKQLTKFGWQQCCTVPTVTSRVLSPTVKD